MYVFQLFDYYSVSRTIFVIAFIEMIVVSYVYGIYNFHNTCWMMFRYFVMLWNVSVDRFDNSMI